MKKLVADDRRFLRDRVELDSVRAQDVRAGSGDVSRGNGRPLATDRRSDPRKVVVKAHYVFEIDASQIELPSYSDDDILRGRNKFGRRKKKTKRRHKWLATPKSTTFAKTQPTRGGGGGGRGKAFTTSPPPVDTRSIPLPAQFPDQGGSMGNQNFNYPMKRQRQDATLTHLWT